MVILLEENKILSLVLEKSGEGAYTLLVHMLHGCPNIV